MQISKQEIILYLITGTVVLLLVGFFIAVLVLLYNKRYKAHLMEKELLQSQFTQTLLQTQLEIQEQTLHQVGQEIHDNTGQLLSLIKLNIATTDVNKPEKAREKLSDTLGLVSQVITGIRQLSHTLDTGFIGRQGLQAAIAYQLQLVEKTGAYTTQLEVVGAEQRLDNQKELILFRMVQETLNNMMKHASATRLTAQLCYEPARLRITLTDNGTGFGAASQNQGIGLAQLIGAHFEVNSQPGKGTQTVIQLPVTVTST
jgi:two-component system, NarL family, sensor kinase